MENHDLQKKGSLSEMEKLDRNDKVYIGNRKLDRPTTMILWRIDPRSTICDCDPPLAAISM